MLLLHQTLHTSSMILNINIHLKRPGAVETGARGVRTFTYRRVLTTIRLYTRIAAGIKKWRYRVVLARGTVNLLLSMCLLSNFCRKLTVLTRNNFSDKFYSSIFTKGSHGNKTRWIQKIKSVKPQPGSLYSVLQCHECETQDDAKHCHP